MRIISHKSKKQYTKNRITLILGGFFVFSIALASTTIETSLDSTIQYIQKAVFTSDGGNTGTTGVVIDGINGSIELTNGTTETINNTKVSNRDTAYTRGDHSTEGYLTTYSETDPIFVTHAANGISAADISRRNSFDSSAEINAVESDPIYSASDASAVTTAKITNRDTAYGRGDHGTEGYITGYTETDPNISTLTQDKRCFASGTQIFCTADEPVDNGGEENLWNTGASDSINYMSGNVGIGTDTPAEKFTVNGGNIQIQDTSPVALNLYTNASTQQDIGEISFLANNQGGSVELTKIHTDYTDNSNDGADLVFSTSSQGLSERLRIEGGGDAIFSDDVYADEYYYNSDINYKENLEIINSALDKINMINGYYFDWKENGKHSIGVIAQELEPIFPELVTTKEDGYKSVKYGNLVAPIIEAIKEFYQEFKSEKTRHEEELELLHQEIELLKTEINSLKNTK